MRAAARLAGLACAICVLGGAFAVPALYVPGLALLSLCVCAFTCVHLAGCGARVELELDRTSVMEGERLQARARVRGPLTWLCRATLTVIPGVPAQQLRARERTSFAQLRAPRRGELLVGPARARFADPFGICALERASPPRRLLALPRVERVGRRELEWIMRGPAARGAHDGGGVDGLAPYRPGAPAARIHWRTVARTGTLVERNAQDTPARGHATIVLDTSAPDGDAALDAAVRAAASLCVALARAGGCELLLPDSAHAERVARDLAAWPRLHARLALVEAGRRPIWAAAAHARRVVLVHAHAPAPAPERRGAHVTCTVSPLARDGVPVLFHIAGCAVQPAAGVRMERAA